MLYVHHSFCGKLVLRIRISYAVLRRRNRKPKQLSRAVNALGIEGGGEGEEYLRVKGLCYNHCRLGAHSVKDYNFV